MRRYPDQVRLQPAAADQIFRIAASVMPHHPAVLVARAEYLLNSGRWREDEMEALTVLLKKGYRLQAGTWLIDMVYALKIGDKDRANEAVKQILLSYDGVGRITMDRLMNEMRKQL